MRPRKTEGAIVETVGDEILVFIGDDEIAVALNRSAYVIYELCDGIRDVAGIVSTLATADVPLDVDHVTVAISNLAESGLVSLTPGERLREPR